MVNQVNSKLGSKATRVATWLLRRPVPTTFPEISTTDRESVKDKLQAGDVLLRADMESANLGHFAYWTVGADYSHSAIYDGNGYVVETRAEGVSTNPVDEFLTGKAKVSVVRPDYQSSEEASQVVREAKKLEGTPYDFRFDSSDASELACAELIEVAMKKVNPNLEVPDVTFMGRLSTVPDGFLQMPNATILVDGKSHYWKNQLHSWPLLLTSAIGVGVGAAVAGGLGAVLGGALFHEACLGVNSLLR